MYLFIHSPNETDLVVGKSKANAFRKASFPI